MKKFYKLVWWLILIFLILFPSLSNASDTQPSSSTADAAHAHNQDWQVDAAVFYESGKLDTNNTVHTAYLPVAVIRNFPKGKLSFTIPYIYQKSGTDVTAISGRPFKTKKSASGETRSSGGIGDLLLRGSYELLSETTDPFSLSPLVQIKFPTAEESKGLGSGEFDQTIGLESFKRVYYSWLIDFNLYYTFIGDPPGTNLDNEFAFAIGPEYLISNTTTVGLFYEERTALVDGESNPQDLVAAISHQLDAATSSHGAVKIGLSDGSSDIGASAGLNFKF